MESVSEISVKKIGELSQNCEEIKVEWTINNIFSYRKKKEYYESPRFSYSDSQWYLGIYPNGNDIEEEESIGWIGLYLMREKGSTHSRNTKYSFGVKTADGTVEQMFNLIWVFGEDDDGYGCPQFLKRSELRQRKSELAPSDALTLSCSLRVVDSSDSISGLNTLSENLEDIFTSQRGCDATLNVKKKEFSVHKSVLAARSPVFAAMFEVDMKEKKTGVVDIDDCDPNAFRDFLMYIYSGKFENFSSNVFDIYRIADKYGVEDLKHACVHTMMSQLSEENVCDAALLAHMFNEFDLQTKTQDFFNENFNKIFASAEWESFLLSNHLVANELLKNFGQSIET